MLKYVNAWVPLGLLSLLLLVVGALKCSERETLLEPMPSGITPPTDCLMECTGMTYIKKLQLQDSSNIRLKDSTQGEPGEYCWSTELKCTVGESFHSAYAVLPVDVSVSGYEQVEVRTADASSSSSSSSTVLRTHSGPATLDEGCGLRYDVTQHFSAHAAGTSFCVRVGAQQQEEEDASADRFLRCPPYLVTFWMRKQSNQQDGG
ncbi:unnamed protein product [Ophioblennius macclurei]